MSTETRTFRTQNPYEIKFNYCRAVRKGPFIFVSGTTSIDGETGALIHPDSVFDQATQIFNELKRAVESLGGTKEDIVRVRMFVKNPADQGEVAKALKDAEFGTEQGPATTMIAGAAFVHNDMKVEIEADAVVF
ncbi:YjgF-like protein [Marasmius fiardii PR-910]|nr:YjgF-like protein [Marasmius fiardii PR-910]